MPKLLIVDDESDVREFAGNFFSKRAIETFIASDGQEALGLISEHQPDLVLLDICMEGMSGMDALRQLRARGDKTRIIMVSGLEDDVVVEEAEGLGVLAFIHKPLILSELEGVVLKELNHNV